MSGNALVVAATAYHIDKFTAGQIKILQKMGFTVHAAASFDADLSKNSTPEYIEACRQRLEDIGVSIHPMPFTRGPLSFGNFSSIKKLQRLIKSQNISLIHCHTPTGGLAARLAAMGKIPTVYTAHGFHFYKTAPIFNWIVYYPAERALARLTDCLIAINEEDYARGRKMPFKNAVHIKGAGIDPRPFETAAPADKAALGLQADTFVFLCVGELSARKNQGALLASFAQARKSCPKAVLVLAGTGTMENAYKKLADGLGISDKTIFLGWRDDVPNLTAMADVVVSAAKQEGLPVNLIEAMMAGVPVIAAPCRGNRELAEQGGITADEDGFAEAMMTLYHGKELRERLGAAGKAASAQYEAETVDKDVEMVYNLVIRKQKGDRYADY